MKVQYSSGVVLCIMVIIFVIMISSCSPVDNSIEDDEKPLYKNLVFDVHQIEHEEVTVKKMDTISDKINVSVFFDATLSMQGFVTLNKPDVYENVIQKLESVIIRSFKDYNEDINIYKFWQDSIPVTKEEYRKDVFNPDFYGSDGIDGNDSSQTNLVNCINAITSELKSTSGDRLALMVTDFVSTLESDRVDFVNSVYNDVLKKGYAFGIIGFQSEFDGKVYDIVTAGISKNFDYHGERPCYIIVVGKPMDVNAFLDGFDETFSSELQEGTYNTYLLSGATLAADTKVRNDSCITISDEYLELMTTTGTEKFFDDSLSSDFISQVHCYEIFEQMLTLCPDYTKPSGKISFMIPYYEEDFANVRLNGWDISYTLGLISGEEVDILTGKPKRQLLSEVSNGDDKQATVGALPQCFEGGGGLITFNNSNIQNESVSLDFTVDMAMIESEMPYALSLVIEGTPKLKGDEVPAWIKNWTMDMRKFDSWTEDPSIFEGNTTPYLFDTIDLIKVRLLKSITHPENLEIGHAYMAFRTEQFKYDPNIIAEKSECAKSLQNDK